MAGTAANPNFETGACLGVGLGEGFFKKKHGISSILSGPKGPPSLASHQKGRVSSEAFSVHTCCPILGFGLPESRLENMQGKNKPGNLLPYSSSSCSFVCLFVCFLLSFLLHFNFPPNLPARTYFSESTHSCFMYSVQRLELQSGEVIECRELTPS